MFVCYARTASRVALVDAIALRRAPVPNRKTWCNVRQDRIRSSNLVSICNVACYTKPLPILDQNFHENFHENPGPELTMISLLVFDTGDIADGNKNGLSRLGRYHWPAAAVWKGLGAKQSRSMSATRVAIRAHL